MNCLIFYHLFNFINPWITNEFTHEFFLPISDPWVTFRRRGVCRSGRWDGGIHLLDRSEFELTTRCTQMYQIWNTRYEIPDTIDVVLCEMGPIRKHHYIYIYPLSIPTLLAKKQSQTSYISDQWTTLDVSPSYPILITMISPWYPTASHKKYGPVLSRPRSEPEYDPLAHRRPMVDFYRGDFRQHGDVRWIFRPPKCSSTVV